VNNQTPIVSVITCFLNEERFLAETIESVVQQDYKDWELILVDDGSTDNSKAIALNYVAQNEGKIFYYEHTNHQNRGLSASRNLGIKKSSGIWIALLDADDVWLPNKLSAQLAIVAQHPQVGMLCEASTYWYSWKEAHKDDVIIKVGTNLKGTYEPFSLTKLLYPLGGGAAPCPSGLLIRKAAWKQVGGFEESFSGNYQLYEDQAFLGKIYLKEAVFISPLSHNLYRQREGSLVQDVTAKGQYHRVRKYFLQWFSAYLKRQNIQNSVVHQALKKALAPYTGLPGLVNTFKRTVKQKLG